MIHEVAIIPIQDEEAEAQGKFLVHLLIACTLAQGFPEDSRAGSWGWSNQKVDGGLWVLLTELVIQSAIPVMVSTMPATAPRIVAKIKRL